MSLRPSCFKYRQASRALLVSSGLALFAQHCSAKYASADSAAESYSENYYPAYVPYSEDAPAADPYHEYEYHAREAAADALHEQSPVAEKKEFSIESPIIGRQVNVMFVTPESTEHVYSNFAARSLRNDIMNAVLQVGKKVNSEVYKLPLSHKETVDIQGHLVTYEQMSLFLQNIEQVPGEVSNVANNSVNTQNFEASQYFLKNIMADVRTPDLLIGNMSVFFDKLECNKTNVNDIISYMAMNVPSLSTNLPKLDAVVFLVLCDKVPGMISSQYATKKNASYLAVSAEDIGFTLMTVFLSVDEATNLISIGTTLLRAMGDTHLSSLGIKEGNDQRGLLFYDLMLNQDVGNDLLFANSTAESRMRKLFYPIRTEAFAPESPFVVPDIA